MHQKQSITGEEIIGDNRQKASFNQHKMTFIATHKSMMIASLAIAAVLAIALVSMQVEGRYLPTRSDESRLESLKQLLKTMLEYNQELEENQAANNWPAAANQAGRGSNSAFGNRVRSSYHKRSPELVTEMAENDNNVRSLSMAEVPLLNR